MSKTALKQQKRDRRHVRIRAQVRGTSERPRLAVSKSNRYITAQLINDEAQTSLAQISSRNVAGAEGKGMAEAAVLVGTAIAEKAKAANVTNVVFDRGGYQYIGAVKALADAARAAGLTF